MTDEDDIRRQQREYGLRLHAMVQKRAWDTIEMFESIYGNMALNTREKQIADIGIEAGYIACTHLFTELGLCEFEFDDAPDAEVEEYNLAQPVTDTPIIAQDAIIECEDDEEGEDEAA